MMFNKKNKNKVLIRVCIGCILPKYSKLIGQGEYTYMNSVKGRINEHYYDYEIFEDDLDLFLKLNLTLLIKNQLLDVENDEKKEQKEQKKSTNTSEWTKKY